MFTKLAAKRVDSQGKPSFWTVPNVKKVDFKNKFGKHFDPKWESAVQKCIALGLELELEVGQFVNEEYKRSFKDVDFDHPEVKAAKNVLARNIKDESYHYQGFELANKLYPVSEKIMDEAKELHKKWSEHPENELSKAYFAECGVFLTSLAILRLVGGSSLDLIAIGVSEDENDHVITNRNTIKYLLKREITPSSSILQLIHDTLNWLTEDLSVDTPVCVFDRDFAQSASAELLEKGRCEALTQMLYITPWRAPFETDNRTKVYGRVTD